MFALINVKAAYLPRLPFKNNPTILWEIIADFLKPQKQGMNKNFTKHLILILSYLKESLFSNFFPGYFQTKQAYNLQLIPVRVGSN